jgi:hypothetical protein
MWRIETVPPEQRQIEAVGVLAYWSPSRINRPEAVTSSSMV